MKMAVQKWGNSLALRIPRAYALETQIAEGSEVDLTLEGGALVIRPVRRKRYALEDLLKGITASNLHDSESTGDAIGKEVW